MPLEKLAEGITNPESSPDTAVASMFWILFETAEPGEIVDIKIAMREKGEWDEADIHFEEGLKKLLDEELGHVREEDGMLELTDSGWFYGVQAQIGFIDELDLALEALRQPG